jgi:hypothetical protein
MLYPNIANAPNLSSPRIALNTPSAIKKLVLKEVKSKYSIPSPLLKVVDFIEKSNLFFFYHTYKLTTYVNPRDAVINGGVLYGGSKILEFLRCPPYLKIAIYVKCAFDVLERYRLLHEACTNLKNAVQFKYPIYQPMEWDFKKNRISPSLAIWWNSTVKKYLQQTWKVIVCAMKVLWEAFKVGIFLRDLYLLTNGDSTVEFYAFTDLAENMGKYKDDSISNAKLLVEHLKSNESLANRLLIRLGSTDTVGNCIDAIFTKYPQILDELKEQAETFKENGRSLLERGQIDLSGRTSILPECRYVPYVGQIEVDQFFAQAK